MSKRIPWHCSVFKQETLQIRKGWSTSANDMRHKQHQEICAKLDRLRSSRLYSDISLVTSIASQIEWKHKCSTNSSLAGIWRTPCKTTMDSTPPDPVQIPCE